MVSEGSVEGSEVGRVIEGVEGGVERWCRFRSFWDR